MSTKSTNSHQIPITCTHMKLVLSKSEVLQTPHACFVVNLDVITVKVVIYAGD